MMIDGILIDIMIDLLVQEIYEKGTIHLFCCPSSVSNSKKF